MSEEFWNEPAEPSSATETPAEEEEAAASSPAEEAAAEEDSLENVLATVPEEHKEAMRRYAKDVERRLNGRFGSRISNAEKAAADARELALSSRQAAPQPPQTAEEYDDNTKQIRAELEKVMPELSTLKDLKEVKTLLQQQAVNQYELAMDSYLNNGPAKAFGDAFTPQHRETLKAVIRASGYDTRHPAVQQAQTLVRDILRASVTQRKNQALNRANAGFETRSFNPSEITPSIAKLTDGGDFDWEGTYEAAARRRVRGE